MPWSEYWTILLQWFVIPVVCVGVVVGAALDLWKSYKGDKKK